MRITPTTTLKDKQGRVIAAKGVVNNRTVDLCVRCYHPLTACICSRTTNTARLQDNEPLAPYLDLDGECEDCPDNDKPTTNVKGNDNDALLVPELDWGNG